ncbi:MAG: hypothetical protein JWN37_247 [Candidatus Nomurabacteria bacterium]|nr:hypothetical protein [Candidatus Nomurabacteria bacterium]
MHSPGRRIGAAGLLDRRQGGDDGRRDAVRERGCHFTVKGGVRRHEARGVHHCAVEGDQARGRCRREHAGRARLVRGDFLEADHVLGREIRRSCDRVGVPGRDFARARRLEHHDLGHDGRRLGLEHRFGRLSFGHADFRGRRIHHGTREQHCGCESRENELLHFESPEGCLPSPLPPDGGKAV